MPHDRKSPPSYTIELSVRQAALLGALVMVTGGGMFVGGYVVGRHALLEGFVLKAEQTSFADQVYTSLYARYEMENSQEVPVAPVVATTPPTTATTVTAAQEALPPLSPPATERRWYAPLAGYGQEAPAQAFARKLKSKGIAVVVKKHAARGTKKEWYQVVTEPSTDRHALGQLVAQIAAQEKLNNVKIKEA
jgi:cell division septation protein DedD